jgi:hypothetical protein
MRHRLRAVALGLALAVTPACAAFQVGATRFENPVTAARTLDQRAYVILNTYAAVIEEATDTVRDPAAPLALKCALGQAERIATPSAQTLQIAVVAYVSARADFETATDESQPALERAAAGLSIAARRLSEAIEAAEAPISEPEDLVRARRG